MLEVFLTVIIPTFLVAGAGAVMQRWRGLTVGAMGPLAIYLLSPALVLNGLLTTELPAEMSRRIVAASVATLIAAVGVSFAVSAALRHTRPLQSGFTLATAFSNSGNMGIPISFLAFGEDGLSVAIIIFVAQASASWPIAIFVAARGRSAGWGPLLTSLTVPSIYVVPVAVGIRWADWTLPLALGTPIELLAAAAIPVMLLVLGFRLAEGLDLERWRSLGVSVVLRLFGAAALALGVTELLGLDGVAQQTVIVVAAMPTAVFTTILASEYDAEPRFVTTSVVASTLLSIATLTVLISLVQRTLD